MHALVPGVRVSVASAAAAGYCSVSRAPVVQDSALKTLLSIPILFGCCSEEQGGPTLQSTVRVPSSGPEQAVARAGRPVNIGTLGSRARTEEAVRMVQEQCLAEMFRVSMDRKTYAPWQVRPPCHIPLKP